MKAVVLISGGLDSSLALKLIIDQGVEVLPVHFTSAFSGVSKDQVHEKAAEDICNKFNVELKKVFLGNELLEIIKNPRHGYGKNFNPCIDCRIYKFKIAKGIMGEVGASFIVTGEVLGQRPMSQHRQALNQIEKESGLEKLIVRPLCAKFFEPSVPEIERWIDRDKFLKLEGRNRKPQIELAKQYGITDFPWPAGGCLLTDPAFGKKMKYLNRIKRFDNDSIELIKLGRLFKIESDSMLVVGRNENENNQLASLIKDDDIVLEPADEPGPTAIARGQLTDKTMDLCARITARYIVKDKNVNVKIKNNNQESILNVKGLTEEELVNFRI